MRSGIRRSTSGARSSVWTVTAEVPKFPVLTEDLETEVCVIGGGISGLTTAYLLLREGRSVVLLEDGAIGSGETGRTTAHLSNALDDHYVELARLHGREGARLAAESHTQAIRMIEKIITDEKIQCGFERLPGYLYNPDGVSVKVLEEELEAAHEAGLREVKILPQAPKAPFVKGPCLRFPDQAQFHPLSYLAALAGAVERLGGRIFCGTHAEKISGGKEGRIETRNGHSVKAAHIVVATNTPVNNRVAIHTKQEPYRTYVIGALLPSGILERALYWDTGDPYHYVRLLGASGKVEGIVDEGKGENPEGAASAEDRALESPFLAPWLIEKLNHGFDLVIIGGEDHKVGQSDDPESAFTRLETWARREIPDLGAVEFRWSGQIQEPQDGLGFIGHNPMDGENVYIVTGDSGNGMTHGTLAGMLITDLIAGRENPWEGLYSPGRVKAKSLTEFGKHNLNVAAKYADWALASGGEAEAIAPGEGALLKQGFQRVAAYRDLDGVLHERSAVCPHLGCIVKWNTAEKTWDCPCHGSRFDCRGHVVNGPANQDLHPLGKRTESSAPEEKAV